MIIFRRVTIQSERSTPVGMTTFADMANGEVGTFCTDCGKLAFCPQCGEDLRGKSICHRAMSTHYRDRECAFHSDWKIDYTRKDDK